MNNQNQIMFYWLSPSFPTGSFNFSQGLEYAVSQSMVANETDLVEWIENNLECGFLRNDAVFLKLAYHASTDKDLEDLTEEQNLLRFTISTGNPDLYETLLTDLIRVTDDSIKQRERSKNTNKIVILSDKIASVSDVEIKNAMIGLLKEQLLNESLVEQDNYYSIEVLEQPRRSKNPDFINLQFIYLGFTFIGFMLSVLVLYIRKRILVS